LVKDLISCLTGLSKLKTAVKIYPGTVAKSRDVTEWEQKHRWTLPTDYREYLTSIGKCKLHGLHDQDHSFSVKLFGLSEIAPFANLAYGKSVDYIPESWYGIADAQDGNFIIMDFSTVKGLTSRIIDGSAEYAPDLAIISKSFTEFLGCSLLDPNTSSGGGDASTGAIYWSRPGHYYGRVGAEKSLP
jgi:hypothetical protein